MPELPEVETTVRELRKKVLKRTFLDVWTDCPKIIKKPNGFKQFKSIITGKEIKSVYRKGKNIIFSLSADFSLLIHQKLTGHLLYGKWKKQGLIWKPVVAGPIASDPMNRFIHLIFLFDNKWQLALCDLRKFSKVVLAKNEEIKEEAKAIGPDPLLMTFGEFKKIIGQKNAKIKQVLMDQKLISGIGNIYSNEALFEARINPKRPASDLKEGEIKRLYHSLTKILKKSISVQGESFSDFRTLDGKKGGFDVFIKVYRKEGKKCPYCGGKIVKEEIGGRSSYFCPNCQK